MNVQEWALVIFTILAQMSVGSFLVLGVVHFYAARAFNMEEADRLSDRALMAIGPVILLALVASLFHLGTPINAYRAVVNFGTSPLSREVLGSVSFTLIGGLFAIMQWRKIGSFALRNVIAWIATIVGLVFVYFMANVYLVPAQPAWNTLATPILFFATTLLLGALAMGAAFVANYSYLKRTEPEGTEAQRTLLRSSLRWIAIVSVVLLGVELVVYPLYLGTLAVGSPAAVDSARLIIFENGAWFTARLVLAFIGAGVFAVFLYQNAVSEGRESILGNFAYAAFVLVLVSEVIGRFLFYASEVRIGI